MAKQTKWIEDRLAAEQSDCPEQAGVSLGASYHFRDADPFRCRQPIVFRIIHKESLCGG
jgi:hypothetical protein